LFKDELEEAEDEVDEDEEVVDEAEDEDDIDEVSEQDETIWVCSTTVGCFGFEQPFETLVASECVVCVEC
jgi:hypothetical protein